MKTTILLTLFFPLLSFSQNTTSSLPEEMISGLHASLISCHREGKKLCPILVSKSTAISLQDYVTIALNLPSVIKKSGLIVSLEDIFACVSKMEKLSAQLKFKEVLENNEVSYFHYWNQSTNWAVSCLDRRELTIDYAKAVNFDAHLLNKGAPIALTLDYHNYLVEMTASLSKIIPQAIMAPGKAAVTIPLKRTKWGLFPYTHWQVKHSANLPAYISFTAR